MRARGPLALFLVAGALLCAGCSIPIDASPHPAPNDPLYVVATTSTTTTVVPTSTSSATPSSLFFIYFVKNNTLLPVRRLLSSPAPGAESLNDALSLLFVGPSTQESHAQITTDFSRAETSAPRVTSYDPVSRLAVVALDPSFGYLSGSELAFALGQIVYTVTAVHNTPVSKVIFTLNGAPFSGYSPSGETIAGPVTRHDYEELYSGGRPAP